PVLLRDLRERIHQPRAAADRFQREATPELELVVDLEGLPAPGRSEAHAFFSHPQRGGEALLHQDLGEIRIAAVLRDPRHVVEELVGRVRAEVGALALLLRQIDQLREVVRAVVDDAQEARGEARVAARFVLGRALEHQHLLRRLLRRQRGAQGGVAAAHHDHVVLFAHSPTLLLWFARTILQSGCIPEALTTLPHFSISSPKNLANASGPRGSTAAPSAESFSLTPASSSAFSVSAPSLETVSFGVFAGANRPHQT